MIDNNETIVSNEETLARIKKLFPDLEITIEPALNNAKGSANPKKTC